VDILHKLKEEGITVLVIEHRTEIQKVADEVLILIDGKLCSEDTLKEVAV